MALVETKFHPPIELSSFSQTAAAEAVRGFRGCVSRRVLPEGVHNVGDHRWNSVTHDWIVEVGPDGAGELVIQPTVSEGRVQELGMLFPNLSIRQRVDSEETASLLAGAQLVCGKPRKAHMIFKQISFEPTLS